MCLAANCRLPTEHCQTEQPKQQPVGADLLRIPKHGGKHWKCESEDRSPFRCDSTDTIEERDLHQQKAEKRGEPENKWVHAEEANGNEGESMVEKWINRKRQ